MRNIFKYIGIISLVLTSFMITEKTSMVINETDDIMTQIRKEKNKYQKDPTNAKIEQNKITPGQYGKKVNEKKSYEEMKKQGKYNPQNYIYDEIKPKISIEDIYDKYIESGNKTKKEISIILITSNDINDIKKYQNIKVIKLKDNNPHNHDKYFTQKQYCYIEEYDETKIDKCKKEKKYTIKINPIKKNLLQETKRNIENGKIITIILNNNTKKELELTINYIQNKGYKIVKIEELLSEKITD